MKFEASTHALAYLGDEEHFPDDLDILGEALEFITDAGCEITVPRIWIQEDIISVYGLREVAFPGISIDRLNHESTTDLAHLVLDRWKLPDQMLASHEINIRSGFIDLELDLLQNESLPKEVPECMHGGIADALSTTYGAVALFQGAPLVVRDASAIYNEIMIPAARNKDQYRSN